MWIQLRRGHGLALTDREITITSVIGISMAQDLGRGMAHEAGIEKEEQKTQKRE